MGELTEQVTSFVLKYWNPCSTAIAGSQDTHEGAVL
jgi:hypothetical protein